MVDVDVSSLHQMLFHGKGVWKGIPPSHGFPFRIWYTIPGIFVPKHLKLLQEKNTPRKPPTHLLVPKPHDLIPNNFRMLCSPPFFTAENAVTIGFHGFIFSPSNSSKESSIHQVEVFVLDVDRSLPDLPGGGRCWQEVLHGHPEVVQPPLVGLNKNQPMGLGFFASHFVFFLGCFTLNDSFMEKCVLVGFRKKSARQNRTDLEKSCNLQSFLEHF